MTVINVGANTGTNINEFLNRYDSRWNVSNRLWLKSGYELWRMWIL